MKLKQNIEKEIIKINNIRIHQYTVLYTSNCTIDVYTKEEINSKTIYRNQIKQRYIKTPKGCPNDNIRNIKSRCL